MPIATLLLITFTFLLIAGLMLTIWGILGKRIGTDPHCRKCRYNLTGLEADKCPECGQPATGKNVRIGLRKRRSAPLIIGSLLLLISLGGLCTTLYARAQSVNWYAYLPTFALIQQAEDEDLAALREIVSRLGAGNGHSDSMIGLISVALQKQSLGHRAPGVRLWTKFLAQMEQAGHLSQEQRALFHDLMTVFILEFRARVRQGEDIPFTLTEWTIPSSVVARPFRIDDGALRIGAWSRPHEFPSHADHVPPPGISAIRRWIVPTGGFEPGTCKVSLQGTKQFIDLPFQRPVHLTGTLEILPPNAPEIVRQVYDTALTDQLRSAIAVTTSNRPTRIRRSKPGTIFVNVTMQAPLPIDCAFEVFARIGDREVALGEFSGSKAQTSGTKTRSIRREHSSFDAETFVPVLRSSVEVAKKTTDMFEIWGGELVLDPVAIVLPLPEPVQSLDD